MRLRALSQGYPTAGEAADWIDRASAVLPLIPRETGTDLANEVSALLSAQPPQPRSAVETSGRIETVARPTTGQRVMIEIDCPDAAIDARWVVGHWCGADWWTGIPGRWIKIEDGWRVLRWRDFPQMNAVEPTVEPPGQRPGETPADLGKNGPPEKATQPLPDHLKAPVKAGDPCPAIDDAHTEHEGKCVYCGAPMAQADAAEPTRDNVATVRAFGTTIDPEKASVPHERVWHIQGAKDCEKCHGAGWLYGTELDEASEDTRADTMTKYTCDGEKCRALNGNEAQ